MKYTVKFHILSTSVVLRFLLRHKSLLIETFLSSFLVSKGNDCIADLNNFYQFKSGIFSKKDTTNFNT